MRIVVDDATGTVAMWSEAATPAVATGQTLVELDAGQARAFRAAEGRFGLVFDGHGFVPVEAPPVPVPVVVTPYQLRVALRAAGKLEAVEAWVAGQPPEIQDGWEYGLKRSIDHPLVVACAAACDLDLPALFQAAGQVR